MAGSSPEMGPLLKASDTDAWIAVNRVWNQGRREWRDPSTDDFSIAERTGWNEQKRPRVALYQAWTANIDEGWTRWLLEQFGFPFTSVHNSDIQAGGLREKYDSIVIPDQTASSAENGHRSVTRCRPNMSEDLGPEVRKL